MCRGLLGLTVACARCHDHKFDPIPTEDYYSLYGVFASPIEPEDLPLIGARRAGAASADSSASSASRQRRDDAFLARHRDEIQADFRRGSPSTSGPRSTSTSTPRDAKLDERRGPTSSPRNGSAASCMRWQDLLRGDEAGDTDPVFVPWHAFAALPADGFAAKAAELAAQAWPTPPRRSNPIVARSFAEAPPASMAEVVARYGTLLAEAESRWQERLKADPAARRSTTPTGRRCGRSSYADDGPVDGRDADGSPRLFDRKERDRAPEARGADRRAPGDAPRRPASGDGPERPSRSRSTPGSSSAAIPAGRARRSRGSSSRSSRAPTASRSRDGSGRLDLAQAIARPDNPLTARVLVNRIWLNHFGAGLVGTPSDFGLRSDPPTPSRAARLPRRRVRPRRLVDQGDAPADHALEHLPAAERQPPRGPGTRPGEPPRSGSSTAAGSTSRPPATPSWPSRAGSTRRWGAARSSLTTAPFTARRTVYGFVDRQNLDGAVSHLRLRQPRRHQPPAVRDDRAPAGAVPHEQPVRHRAVAPAGRAARVGPGRPRGRVRQLYRVLFGRAPEPHELELGVAFAGRPSPNMWNAAPTSRARRRRRSRPGRRMPRSSC